MALCISYGIVYFTSKTKYLQQTFQFKENIQSNYQCSIVQQHSNGITFKEQLNMKRTTWKSQRDIVSTSKFFLKMFLEVKM